MGIRQFIHNLKYLWKYNVRQHEQASVLVREGVMPMLWYVDQLYKNEPAGSYKKPIILSEQETLDELCRTEKSLIRIGDGELFISMGQKCAFQRADARLQQRMREVLHSDDDNVMLALTGWLWYKRMSERFDWQWFLEHYSRLREEAERRLRKGKVYYSAEVSMPYRENYRQTYEGGGHAQWRTLWEGRDVVVICGDRVFKKLQYNVFDNARSIEYIHTPTRDAFDEYDAILARALQVEKHKLVCLMVGPTAKVLGLDMARRGYRVLDVGHLAKDYDCLKRKLHSSTPEMQSYFAAD